MAEPSGAQRSASSARAVLAVAVVAIVGLIVFVQRPAGDTAPAATPDPSDTSDTSGFAQPDEVPDGQPSGPTTPPFTGKVAVPTDEEFCAEFRRVDDLQRTYSRGRADTDDLREAAQALVETGVPAAVSLPARSGYYTLIGGLYDFVGLGLDPAAVGAPDAFVATGEEAFAAYLTQSCGL
ncbi:hypothetical protein F4692_000443 [Nocardioides cavernae]|uniref:Uncharacterized protein n=1 Tax=Nocardioides cavernae TaxID=1921566 RepID=A0A7Y9KQ98_9ACTN|nr:hypothetical protein [Nocardioides cavernae]NYE35339.1 hypothetical protein [Nocardioides cavernae]